MDLCITGVDMNKKYNVILFDMDGTIADTDPMLFATMSVLYDKFKNGQRKTKEEIKYFSGPPIRGTLKKEFPELDPEFIYNEFYQTSKMFYESEHVLAYPYCRKVLLKLKEQGFRLGVVTNKVHDLAEITLKVVKLDDLMGCLIGINDVRVPKPNKEGIIKAINILGGDVEHTLYVGDNDMDLQTANNAGVDCCLISWGPRELSKDIKPKYKITSYLDLEGILYE